MFWRSCFSFSSIDALLHRIFAWSYKVCWHSSRANRYLFAVLNHLLASQSFRWHSTFCKTNFCTLLLSYSKSCWMLICSISLLSKFVVISSVRFLSPLRLHLREIIFDSKFNRLSEVHLLFLSPSSAEFFILKSKAWHCGPHTFNFIESFFHYFVPSLGCFTFFSAIL